MFEREREREIKETKIAYVVGAPWVWFTSCSSICLRHLVRTDVLVHHLLPVCCKESGTSLGE